ncbi:Eco57I restriction-modification methylase domain-containing protein [Capnocytophaga gingivalis]|uniref:Eco57I restriction-modification methylase domain-containing protein n=1 Tax=Capnocytophaga gingivalis TaxID=1017 RepID=UPI003C6C62B0
MLRKPNTTSNEGFDIVIGNPPYGAKYDDKTKSYYKKSYVTAKSMPFLRISPLRNVRKNTLLGQ